MKKYKETSGGVLVPCGPKDHQFDGLVNIASGLGTAKAKRSHNRWEFGAQGDYASWDACYQTNWIARAIIDEWAADAVREWRSIKSDGAEDIEGAEDALDLTQVTEEAIAWSRLYGGAGVVMITNQDLEKPLNLNAVKKGSLERLEVFDRYDLTPIGETNTYDMLARNYLRPDYFTVSGGSQRIHHSHIAFFNGARLPKRQARMNYGWGDSELRRTIDEIADMVAAKDGIAELLQEVNIDVITRTGLTDEITTDQDDSIIKRYELFSLMKSTINMALLDGDEKLERQTLQLGGVAQVLETFMTWISGAARMPATKIFGKSPAGMNATGESDMKQYYDQIRSKQQGDLSRSMRQIDEVLVRSALGYWPDSFDWRWNPLAQLNGVETAQEQLLQAQKNQIYLGAGIIQRSQIQRVLQSNEEYQFADEDIEQLENLEEPNLFDDVDNESELDHGSEPNKLNTGDGWITVNGAKVHVNENGEVTMGMEGKQLSESNESPEKNQTPAEKKLEGMRAKRKEMESKLNAQLEKNKALKSELSSAQSQSKGLNEAQNKIKEIQAKLKEVQSKTRKIDNSNSKNDN
jgi:uncharacterized protein